MTLGRSRDIGTAAAFDAAVLRLHSFVTDNERYASLRSRTRSILRASPWSRKNIRWFCARRRWRRDALQLLSGSFARENVASQSLENLDGDGLLNAAARGSSFPSRSWRSRTRRALFMRDRFVVRAHSKIGASFASTSSIIVPGTLSSFLPPRALRSSARG